MTWGAFLNAISTLHRDPRRCLEAWRSITVHQIQRLEGAIRPTPIDEATCTSVAFRGTLHAS